MSRKGRRARLIAVALRQPGLLRTAVLSSVLGSFVFGAFAAAYCFPRWPGPALAAPIAFLAWIILVDWRTPIADVRELDAVSDPALTAAGVTRDMIPREIALFRLHCASVHGRDRAPDFAYWAERLPAEHRILLLAISPLLTLDEDAAAGLREGAESLRASGRRLVIGGITPQQYRVLARYSVLRTVSSDDVWPDLEIGRAHV